MIVADHCLRAHDTDGRLRAVACCSTGLVETIRNRQATDGLATIAVGRLATGAALMAIQDQVRVALLVEGNGPLGRMQAEAHPDGGVRAAVRHGQVLATCAVTTVTDAVGRAGFLHVIKDLGLKEPYRGMVQLVSPEIAEDIAWYYTTSEQIPSAVALGVLPSADGEVQVAGGFLVQAMPGCPDSLLAELEERLRSLGPVTDILKKGGDPRTLLDAVFGPVPFTVSDRVPLRFSCACETLAATAIAGALPADELAEYVERREDAVITCGYCGRRLTVGWREIEALLASDR